MKHCEDYTALISAAVDGVLTPGEERLLHEHLSQCPDCLAIYQEMLAIHDAFDGWEENPPADLTGAVMGRIRRERKRNRRRRFLPVAAAAACCAFIILGYYALPSAIRSSTVSDTAADDAPSVNASLATDDGAPSSGDTEEAVAGKSSAPFAVQPEAADSTDSKDCEEQIMEGVLTYFDSGAPAVSGAAIMPQTQSNSVSIPTLSSADPALLQWMSDNVPETGYVSENRADLSAWLITAEEYDSLTAYLTESGADYDMEWEDVQIELPENSGEVELICVIFLGADQ